MNEEKRGRKLCIRIKEEEGRNKIERKEGEDREQPKLGPKCSSSKQQKMGEGVEKVN
jgi:hypothetical protein